MKVKKMLIALLLFVLMCLMAIVILAPKQLKPNKEVDSVEELEHYLNRLTEDNFPPSLSLTVASKDEILFNKSFGHLDIDKQKNTPNDAIYPWWSVTKLYTAVGIMKLVEDEVLELDAPIKTYLPEFDSYLETGEPAVVTVRQLLHHQAGFRRMMPEVLEWIHLAPVNRPTVTEFLNTRLVGDFREHSFEPGTDSEYTNTAYIVLGAIIESVTNKTYESYIQEMVLHPMGMLETGFSRSVEDESKTPVGSNAVISITTGLVKIFGRDDFFKEYVQSYKGNRMYFKSLYTDYSPSTGLSGTSEDMAKLGQLVLNRGFINDQQIIEASTLDLMLGETQLSDLGHEYGDHKEALTGLGFKSWRINDLVVYGHGGGGPGYGSILAIIPEKQLVFAFLCNDTNIDRNLMIEIFNSVSWYD